MCFFVGYKYEGGGDQIWDPKRRVTPTLNNSRPQPADEDEPTAQPALDHITEPTTLPAAPGVPAPTLPFKRQRTTMAYYNDDTSSAHYNTSTRALDERASCGMQRRIR